MNVFTILGILTALFYRKLWYVNMALQITLSLISILNRVFHSLIHGPVQVVNSTVMTMESCHSVEPWYTNRHVDSAMCWVPKESYSIPGRGKRFLPSPKSPHPLSGTPSHLFSGFRGLFPQGETEWRFNSTLPQAFKPYVGILRAIQSACKTRTGILRRFTENIPINVRCCSDVFSVPRNCTDQKTNSPKSSA